MKAVAVHAIRQDFSSIDIHYLLTIVSSRIIECYLVVRSFVAKIHFELHVSSILI